MKIQLPKKQVALSLVSALLKIEFGFGFKLVQDTLGTYYTTAFVFSKDTNSKNLPL